MAAAIREEASELEAMRRGDRSWHPCRVSLSATAALSVIIDSNNVDEAFDIANKNGVLSYLRYRSVPLQEGECSNIEEGDRVLALNKDQSKPLFYDAVVEKVARVRHSKRVYCRCTFKVKWLHCESQLEPVVLSSNLIMKLSTKKIDNHSVVAEFLRSLNSTTIASDVEETQERTPESDVQGLPEYDLQGLLEKQIEEISRIVDSSKKNGMEETPLGYSKDVNGVTASNTWHGAHGSTKTQKIKQPEWDVQNQMEETNFLTPLAARAALALLVQELPNSKECCDYSAKEEASPNVHGSVNHTRQTLHFFQDFSDKLPQRKSGSNSNMVHKQNDTRFLHSTETESNTENHRSRTRSTRSMVPKGNRDLTEETTRKSHYENKKVLKRLTQSTAGKETGDQVEEISNKCHSKNNGTVPPLDEEPSTKLGKEKDMFLPLSPVHKNPTNKHPVQKTQLNNSPPSHATLISGENGNVDVSSTPDGDSLSRKGTKRARMSKPTPNDRVDKDKEKFESLKKPELRCSPRLRILQHSGSQK